MKIPYKKIILKNGLTVILHPMPFVNSVSINIAIGAGPRYETKETSGLAHFLEHMLFEGTKNMPTAKDVAQYIERVGGIGRAFTDKEYVSCNAKVPKQHLEVAFSYLSDVLLNPLLENNAIKREKGIVMEELKRSKDNPESDMWDLWFEWIWGGNQSLGRSTLGNKSTIENITREQLQSYFNSYYHAANMVIAVVGNFSINEAEKYSLKYFGKNKYKDIPKFTKVAFEPQKIHTKIINKSSHQVQLILGYATNISYDHKDRLVVKVIADILSTGVSSRLFHRLIYELGISYSAGAYSWIFADNGLFSVFGGFSPDNIKKAIKVIIEEIDKLKKEKVSNRELDEAKEKDKSQLYFSLETPDALANFYASQQITEKRILTPEEISKRIDGVSAEDIKRVAKQYFKLDNLRLAICGPLKKEDGISIEEILR